MEIYKYEVLSKKINKDNPVYNAAKHSFRFKIYKTNYKYCLEVKRIENNIEHFYLLLSSEKFHDNCKQIRLDNYGRYKLYCDKELCSELEDCLEQNDVINIKYVETEDNYDVFEIF